MSTVPVVVPFTAHDAPSAERLAKWIGHLEPENRIHSVVLIPSSVVPVARIYDVFRRFEKVSEAVEVRVCEHPDAPWPVGPNRMFDWAAKSMKEPFLWLEPDCVPLSQGWLDRISKAYTFCRKPILCDWYDKTHCSGIAVYEPAAAQALSRAGDQAQAWDSRSSELFRGLSADTDLIHHFWGKKDIPPRFSAKSDGTEGSVTPSLVHRKAVLFHRCKDGSLMRVLCPGWAPRESLPVEVNKPKTVYVALGRYGDIIHILPALRSLGRCTVAVSKAFAGVLDGVSYVDPLVLDVSHTDVLPAKEILSRSFQRICITQMSAPGWEPARRCQSFTEDAWARLGMVHRYDDPNLRLEFDRRDYARERLLIRRFVPAQREKPFVLVNLAGHSSMFPDREVFLQRLKAELGNEVTFCDLSGVHALRIYDLCGIMDVADALVTIDTASLHLAAATAVPVIAILSGTGGWYRSKPRCRILASVDAAAWKEGTDSIISALRSLQLGRFIHVYERHEPLTTREELAQETWARLGWIQRPFETYPRDARSVGDKRKLPFLRDCLEHALSASTRDSDCIVLTNSDVGLGPEVPVELARIMAQGVVATGRRVDVGPMPSAPNRLHPGRDLLAFRAGWLRRNFSSIPDFILGASQWDSWATQFSRRLVGAAPQIESNPFSHVPDCEVRATLDSITHTRHRAYWVHNQDAPSELHNGRLYQQWLRGNQVELL